MAARSTGFALLGACSVQEAHDLALVAQAATLAARVPFVHFMDGFRTSHELNKLTLVGDAVLRAMVDDELVWAHRERALSPAHPVVRGTAHNPDTFFQARESASPFHARVPAHVLAAMDRFHALTGRRYQLFRYDGEPEAERVVVAMGSGSEVVRETALHLAARGEPVGALQVLLYRPFSAQHFLDALPKTVRTVMVLDRCKEPGGAGEPLYRDVVTTLAEAVASGRYAHMPRVFGGRYGLSSKDFHPGMAKAVFDEAARPHPKNGFTVGIDDDVSHTSVAFDAAWDIEDAGTTRALFYGLGSDGTVGANKASVQLLAQGAERHAQGYFVYDSHKSGAETVSHLRFGPRPIHRPYLVRHASFVACHHFESLRRVDVLAAAAPGATVLLNAPYPPEAVWDELPQLVQRRLIDQGLRLFVIDATKVARDLGLGLRVNTILQTCFFAISGVWFAAISGRPASSSRSTPRPAFGTSCSSPEPITAPTVSATAARSPALQRANRRQASRFRTGCPCRSPARAGCAGGKFDATSSEATLRHVASIVPYARSGQRERETRGPTNQHVAWHPPHTVSATPCTSMRMSGDRSCVPNHHQIGTTSCGLGEARCASIAVHQARAPLDPELASYEAQRGQTPADAAAALPSELADSQRARPRCGSSVAPSSPARRPGGRPHRALR